MFISSVLSTKWWALFIVVHRWGDIDFSMSRLSNSKEENSKMTMVFIDTSRWIRSWSSKFDNGCHTFRANYAFPCPQSRPITDCRSRRTKSRLERLITKSPRVLFFTVRNDVCPIRSDQANAYENHSLPTSRHTNRPRETNASTIWSRLSMGKTFA